MRSIVPMIGLSLPLGLVGVLFSCLGTIADEATTGTSTTVEVRVYPETIALRTAADRQTLVVQAVEADGITRDVTAEAVWSLADPELVDIEGGLIRPRQAGSSTLTIAFEGHHLDVPVTVEEPTAVPALSFRLDVMPVFMKGGCNSGSCHGAARGKDGFRLSLFGFDPEGDYHRLTREMVGRRVNRAVPADSTLLEKAINSVPHTGGQRFQRDSVLYETLQRWIAEGARDDDLEALPTLESVDVYPPEAVLDGNGATQQLVVRASYSDGTDRDVTDLAVFLTNNETSASVDASGRITAGERGEAFVMARYETFTVGLPVIVLPQGLEFTYPDEPEANRIDTLVAQKLRKLRMAPSPLSDDETFLRRVCLDLIGLPPTPEQHAAFVDSDDPDKRAKLVDQLLQRKEFAELWVNKWAEMLQIRSSNQISYKNMYLYYNWLVEKIQSDTPMDQMVAELLGSNGGTFRNPATNYYQMTRDQKLMAENVAQVFMGMRIQCAQCHNHPFDRWTMDDYYGFVAFFSQIGRKRGEDYRETIVYNSQRGETKHPVGGRTMAPKFLGGDAPETNGQDRRVVLSRWLASPENPYFARSFVNRVWAHFFGIGIVEPVDDFRISNPPSNAELLDALAVQFTESNYDLKALVKSICLSRTYQRSTERNATNERDLRNFAHANLRRIKAEYLLDAISTVTDTRDDFRGLPPGARAVQIADGRTSTYFLTTFGRATRETVCSCEVKMEPTLSQALHLLNGDTVNAKIRQGGLIKTLVTEELDDAERIDRLYVRVLGRRPTPTERAALLPDFEGLPDQDKPTAYEDLFWALLNSREFLFIR